MDNMPSLADIAAVTDGKTDGFNGGFWIFALIILFAMMGGGFGDWNRQGEFGQYATAASQQEILFGQHFGQINDRLTNIGNGICDSTFALNNAITTEGRNLSSQLANCCCEQRLGIANLSAQMNQNTCDITTAIHAEAEATRSLIQANEMQALRDKVSSLEMDNRMYGVVRYPNGYTYNAGNSPFCGNNCGCCC